MIRREEDRLIPLTGANLPCCRESFRADGFLGRRTEAFQLVTNADQKHRLFGILEEVDDSKSS